MKMNNGMLDLEESRLIEVEIENFGRDFEERSGVILGLESWF